MVSAQFLAAPGDYYVDINSIGGSCSDTNPGTITRPWCTISKANSVLRAGDTVYIREGTYNEEIKPARSGTEGNYITYTHYNNEEVIIDRNNAGNTVTLSGRSYINIDGLILLNAVRLVEGWPDGFSHSIVQNNIMENTVTMSGGRTGIRMRNNSNYNKILNNKILLETQAEMDTPGEDKEYDALYIVSSSYNLIEGNDISMAGHVVLTIRQESRYNVVRNNTLHDSGDIIFTTTYTGTQNFLIENNVFYNPGIGPDGWGHAAKSYGSKYGIFRNNIFYDNDKNGTPPATGHFALQTKDSLGGHSEYHRVYGNTFYGGDKYGVNLGDNSEFFTVRRNILKNNIIYKSTSYPVREGGELSITYDELPYDVLFDHNLIRKDTSGEDVVNIRGTGSFTLSEVQTTYPDSFKNNIDVDPMLVDPDNQDFHLQSDSPLIDAGAFLTTITSDSDTGTSFIVEDAKYFMDGWGIIEGDLIQLQGQTQTARITNVNYDTNVITVDTPLTWSSGQGVSLAYSGSAPDIGAYEYGGTPSPPPEPEPTPRPSISLSKSVLVNGQTLSQAQTGDELTYTITYINTSQTEAKNIVITDNVPQGTSYVQGSASSGGVYEPSTNQIEWSILTLLAGGQGSVSFRVTVE